MKKWLYELKYDPLTSLLNSGDKSISLFVQRDLLDKEVSIQNLWLLSEPQRIIKKQKPNGSWVYPGAKDNIRTQENYNQFETYRWLGILGIHCIEFFFGCIVSVHPCMLIIY